MSQAAAPRTIKDRFVESVGSRRVFASALTGSRPHPDVRGPRDRAPEPHLDGVARLRQAIGQLLDRHGGRRVAVLIADGGEKLGDVATLGEREIFLAESGGEPCAIPLDRVLSVQMVGGSAR